MAVKFIFSSSVSPNVKIFLHIFMCDNKFYVLQSSTILGQIDILHYTFANSANNTAIISAFNPIPPRIFRGSSGLGGGTKCPTPITFDCVIIS